MISILWKSDWSELGLYLQLLLICQSEFLCQVITILAWPYWTWLHRRGPTSISSSGAYIANNLPKFRLSPLSSLLAWAPWNFVLVVVIQSARIRSACRKLFCHVLAYCPNWSVCLTFEARLLKTILWLCPWLSCLGLGLCNDDHQL